MPHLMKFLGLISIMLGLSWLPVGEAINFIIMGIAIWRLTE